jgi:hypothetical protein
MKKIFHNCCPLTPIVADVLQPPTETRYLNARRLKMNYFPALLYVDNLLSSSKELPIRI